MPRLIVLPHTTLARLHGPICTPWRDAERVVGLTLRIRPRYAVSSKLVKDVIDGHRRPFTREEFRKIFGPAAADLATVAAWARKARLQVKRRRDGLLAVDVSGSAARTAAAFGATLVCYTHQGKSWMSRVGSLSLPAELFQIVTGVFGFDEGELARPGVKGDSVSAAGGRARSFTVPQIARWYGFPKSDGRGQTVGVISLGGGYTAADNRAYFTHLKLPHPKFTNVSVLGARNAPGGPSQAFDGEVTGDIQTIGALVPRAHIVIYVAPNLPRGFLDAVSAAVYDGTRKPMVISISWGRNEMHWTRRMLRVFDEVLRDATLMGITICVASGDDGAFADALDREPHVCFPAASQWVVACGGTSLANRASGRIQECAWHDASGASGGGVSTVCPCPPWQRRSIRKGGGRHVPDVAANGDPLSGYRVFVKGKWRVGAGTSASAPVWAGLTARINQLANGPQGLFTPFLYHHIDELRRNGAINQVRLSPAGRVQTGWNRHTGLGVTHGGKLTKAMLKRHADKNDRAKS